jgi:hypothetical protein
MASSTVSTPSATSAAQSHLETLFAEFDALIAETKARLASGYYTSREQYRREYKTPMRKLVSKLVRAGDATLAEADAELAQVSTMIAEARAAENRRSMQA